MFSNEGASFPQDSHHGSNPVNRTEKIVPDLDAEQDLLHEAGLQREIIPQKLGTAVVVIKVELVHKRTVRIVDQGHKKEEKDQEPRNLEAEVEIHESKKPELKDQKHAPFKSQTLSHLRAREPFPGRLGLRKS